MLFLKNQCFSDYDWLCDATMGGGILALVGSHVIDLISYLTNQKAVRVHAVIRTFNQTTEHINGIRNITSPDFCSFQMELKSGALVTATLTSHIKGQMTQEILVCGPNGHLVVKSGDLHGCQGQQEEPLHVDAEMVRETPVMSDSIPKPYIKGLQKMIGALREAFQPVEDKSGWIKQPVSRAANFEDGLYVQAVIDALKRSNKKREWAKVHVMTEEPDPIPLLSAAVRSTAISI